MNSFGRLLRVSILGESHGDLVGIVIDGCPPGLALATEDFLPDLERRRGGKKGTTARKEDDLPVIRSGFFKGRTTGAPILIVIENRDADSRAYEEIRVTPRPGNADFTAHRKFGGYQDYRGGGPLLREAHRAPCGCRGGGEEAHRTGHGGGSPHRSGGKCSH